MFFFSFEIFYYGDIFPEGRYSAHVGRLRENEKCKILLELFFPPHVIRISKGDARPCDLGVGEKVQREVSGVFQPD